MGAMNQGAVSASDVSETERSILATQDLSASITVFCSIWGLLWLEWNNCLEMK
jgi:hypothetical protein